ncbi:MAG: winged helix-turn-helix domain-containing protein, partial [Candidatus Acidiferrum sp.]
MEDLPRTIWVFSIIASLGSPPFHCLLLQASLLARQGFHAKFRIVPVSSGPLGISRSFLFPWPDESGFFEPPMSNNDKDLYEFGPFRLDTGQQRLLRGDQRIPLQPKAFETLLFLVRNGEKLSLKEDLLNAVWPDAFVEESNLTQNVFVLRKALGDEDGDRRYIITVPGRGYRFAESVHIVPTSKTDVPTVPITPPADITTKVATEKVLRAEPPATTPRSSFYWLALLAGMVLLCCVGYLALRQYRYGQAAAGTTRIMLAVLPFKNLTGDPEQEYFADGLTEELITQLGQLHPEQLGVISRTSVMCYKQGDKRLDQ